MDERPMPAARLARRRIRQPGQVSALDGALPIRYRRSLYRERISGGTGVAVAASAAMPPRGALAPKWCNVDRNPGVIMEAFVPVTITAASVAFIVAAGLAVTMPARAEPSSQPVPQVAVVRATNGCFS